MPTAAETVDRCPLFASLAPKARKNIRQQEIQRQQIGEFMASDFPDRQGLEVAFNPFGG